MFIRFKLVQRNAEFVKKKLKSKITLFFLLMLVVIWWALLAEWFFSLGIFMFFFGIFSYKKRTLGSYLLVQWQLSFFHNFFLYKNSEDPEALSRKGTFVSPLWFFFIWQPWIVYCWPFLSHHEQFLSFRAEHSHRCGKANQRISNVPGYLVSV